MTANRRPIQTWNFVLAAQFARGLLKKFRALKSEGRGECRMHAAPAVPCAKKVKKAHEHTGSAEAIRHSLRNGFTAYFVLSPAIGLV
jgi:hypothetical protein